MSSKDVPAQDAQNHAQDAPEVVASDAAKLDFFSPLFDPVLALTLPGVDPPLRDVKKRANLTQCLDLLPATHPEYVAAGTTAANKPVSASSVVAAPASVSHASKEAGDVFLMFGKVIPPSIQTRLLPSSSSTASNVPPQMEGPLVVLRKLLLKKCRIRVVIRRAAEVRGTCEGLIRAYDKHMNLILMDVDEQWTRWEHDTSPVSSSSSSADSKKQRRPLIRVQKQRHVRQLFVRGDNIVLVCELPSPQLNFEPQLETS